MSAAENIVPFPRPDSPEPPHNVEVEQALLGALLLNNEAYAFVHGIISHEHFYEPVHGEIYKAIQALIEAGKIATPVTLKGALTSTKIADLTPAQYLARLASEATSVVNAPDYARTLRDLADRRNLIMLADELKSQCELAPTEYAPGGLVVDAISKLDSLLDSRADRSGLRAVTAMEALTQSIELASAAYQNNGAITGISYGLRDLDSLTLGLHKGEVVILAGRPGMGKSGLGLSAARHASEAGHGTILFSLEMSAAMLGVRLLSDAAFGKGPRISYHDIRGGKLSETDFARLANEAQRLSKLPLIIEPSPAPTIAQIAARVRRAQERMARAGKSLDLVIVDYMQLASAGDRYRGNRVSEVMEISAGLKRIAKEQNVAMLALSQLSRQVESRDDKRPQLSDLRESGSIEQDADTVIFLYREEYYLQNREPKPGTDAWFKWEQSMKDAANKLQIIVAKQRHGPTNTVHAFFDAGSNAVRDLDARRAV